MERRIRRYIGKTVMAGDFFSGWIIEGGMLDYSCIRNGRLFCAERRKLPASADSEQHADPDSAAKSAAAKLRGEITLGLPLRDILARVVNLPTDDPSELEGMVDLQADKLSPFPTDSIVISHEIIAKTEMGFRVLIAITREDTVNNSAAALHKAGKNISRVDASILGRWETFKNSGFLKESGKQIELINEFGYWELIIHQHGEPLVLRTLDVEDSGTDEEIAATLANEITYAMMTAEMEHGAGTASSISIWRNDDAPNTNIAQKLSEILKLPIKTPSLSSLPSRSEGIARRSADKTGIKLNLTPNSWIEIQKNKARKRKLLTTALIVAGTWAVVTATLFLGPTIEAQKLKSLQSKKNSILPSAIEVRNLRRKVIQLERYGKGNLTPLECLREISLVQPIGIDLTSFSYKKDESLKISGETSDVNLVYEFKNRLDSTGIFFKSAIQGPTLDRQRGKNTFEIELTFQGAKEQ